MKDEIDQFLAIYKSRLKASSLQDYRSILTKHLMGFPTFDALNLGLESYLAGLEVSGKRKNNILSAARTFIEWGRRRQLFDGFFLPIPNFPHRTKKTPPLTVEEANLVMSFSPWPYRDFFKLSILTGLRTGEALALRFDDFDLRRRIILIQRSFTAGYLGTTKTRSGEREIPLLRPLWELYQSRQLVNRRASPWFFFSQHRGVLSLKKIRQVWRAFLDVMGIAPRVLYSTRHTYASLAISAGEDPLWVAKVLGHERPDQLFLRYASYLEGQKEDGKKILQLVLGGESFMRLVK